MYVQGAAEDEGKSEHIIHHVRIVGTAGAHDDVLAAGSGVLVGNLWIGIRHGDDDGTGSHGAHHILRDHTTDGESEEHIGVYHRLGQGAQFGILCEALLVGIHARGTALVNHTLGVAESNILALHAEANVMLGSRYSGSTGAVDDKADFGDVLADNVQSVQ